MPPTNATATRTPLNTTPTCTPCYIYICLLWGGRKPRSLECRKTEEECQELYRVAVREDGGAVREDDAEPELLDDEGHALEEGAVVAVAAKEEPLVWRTFPEECVELSEGGTVATAFMDTHE
jgi:hypothetical protein